jgi:hypothetical protein
LKTRERDRAVAGIEFGLEGIRQTVAEQSSIGFQPVGTDSVQARSLCSEPCSEPRSPWNCYQPRAGVALHNQPSAGLCIRVVRV